MKVRDFITDQRTLSIIDRAFGASVSKRLITLKLYGELKAKQNRIGRVSDVEAKRVVAAILKAVIAALAARWFGDGGGDGRDSSCLVDVRLGRGNGRSRF